MNALEIAHNWIEVLSIVLGSKSYIFYRVKNSLLFYFLEELTTLSQFSLLERKDKKINDDFCHKAEMAEVL